MKTKTVIKSACAVLLACLMVLALAACGGKQINVTINDAGTKTEVTANTGNSVSEVLKNAGIKLGDKDVTEPAADSKLEENTKEITVKRYAKVTVVKGSEKKEVELVGGTVEEAIKKSGFTLADGDAVDADSKAYLKDGMTITITKGVKVSLTVDGKTTEVSAGNITVKELLDKQGVKLGKDDVCTEKLDEKLKDGMKITIKRVEYKEETKKESIDFEIEEEYDSSLDSGERKTTQEGAKGEKEVTYKVKYVDGKEAGREKLSEKVTKEAVNEVISVGTKEEVNQDAGEPEQQAEPAQPAQPANPEPQQQEPAGKTVVSKTPVYNCDGSGHGYYEITYSDGSMSYEEF